MKHLIDEAGRLAVTIEVATLPTGEPWRYIHSTLRIILSDTLTGAQTHASLAMALGHAFYGEYPVTENSAGLAESRGADMHAIDLFLDVVNKMALVPPVTPSRCE